MSSYSALVRTHFFAPHGTGELATGPGLVVSGKAGAQADRVAVAFQLRVAAGVIDACVFRARGCPYVIAAASLVAAELPGQSATAMRELTARLLADRLAVPRDRLGRLLAIEDALRTCWQAWENSGLSASPSS